MAAKKAKTSATPSSKGSELAERMLRAHLAQLKRVSEKRGVGGLRSLYQAARADLYDRLRRVGRGKQTATATTLRAMIGQVEAAIEALSTNLELHLRDTGKAAAELGARHAVDEWKALETHFRGTAPVLDLERGAVFRGMVEDVDSSLLRRHRLATRTWSLGAIRSIEEKLSIGTMAGRSLDEMIGDVMDAGNVVDEERWKAERIVRTEASYAHGAAKQEALSRTSDELGEKLHKRLVETFDDRTGDDSFLIHGQTVPFDRPFNFKRKRAGSWVVVEFMHPPNRPNDRGVSIPWDPTWEETEEERPLTRTELDTARPTFWRTTIGVEIPPGHKPGKPYRA